MASGDELACTYAALILSDDNVSITGDKIATILKAAGVSVEPYWPGLFARALDGINVKDLITNIGSSAGSAPAASAPTATGGGGAAPAAAAKEEKKEEKPKKEDSESEDDMGFGLFD
ncbi:60S acidic ribosomal protein P1-like [Dreissena polymorpha]|uniref:Large ribosomal subunit protein P1 n=1 Tax=Dreissena polymorpha TaxID=45954 RepID=A0A9D4DGM2_DREPO|nr:60S acidic ribosomal protein P1-like [Dreissena polymorpha]KAH3748671.1 hypothetical protein DPMN_183119 [Dreissena polymorpha]